jgi:hypothetical protein
LPVGEAADIAKDRCGRQSAEEDTGTVSALVVIFRAVAVPDTSNNE